jgi:hypothetical protein
VGGTLVAGMEVDGTAVGGKGGGVKVNVGGGVSVSISVGIGVTVPAESGVCAADSGWKGVGVGDALGSFVTRLRGGGGGETGVAEKHAVTKVKDKRQNVKRIALFSLIGILEVLAD